MSPLTSVIKACSNVIRVACSMDEIGWLNFNNANYTERIDVLKRAMDEAVESFESLEKRCKELLRTINNQGEGADAVEKDN